jgi:hypothetical protein
MFKYLAAAVPAALFFSSQASAQEAQCDSVTNNGHQHLTDADGEQSDFDLFYNPTNGLVRDSLELGIQASTSSRARDIAENDYTIRVRGAAARYNFVLGKLYIDKLETNQYESETEREVYVRVNILYAYLVRQVRAGKSVTVVAHSQGNFLIEAAIAMMHYRGEQDIISRIRVVGVAPVSSSTPNGVYFSLEEDRAISIHRANTSLLTHFSVLPANATACVARLMSNTCDEARRLSEENWMMHSFVRMYMNPNIVVNGVSLVTRIRDQVVRARDELIPPAQSHPDGNVGSGDCNAYFWVESVTRRSNGQYNVRFQTTREQSGRNTFGVSYRFTITLASRWHNPSHGSPTWWPSYSTDLSEGRYIVTITKDRTGDTNDTAYTREILVGPQLIPEQNHTC